MGRLNTLEEQERTLAWAAALRAETRRLEQPLTVGALMHSYGSDLRGYFALSCLSRSTTAPRSLVVGAYEQVFRVRVTIERSMHSTIRASIETSPEQRTALFDGRFYGASKKQGVSIRLPLSSCRPTKLCAGGCYAHDVLDAAPQAMTRGVINGAIAAMYEEADSELRSDIMLRLASHSRKAIQGAIEETKRLREDWNRRPNIRFSHVGEITAFPSFANALARQVRELSDGDVDCVVYTRHPRASELDSDLWIINFTLDGSSNAERRAWAPQGARIVYSAFGGKISEEADVNFLEHHRWVHLPPIGTGTICPATLPETRERTCDAVRCDRCFRPAIPRVLKVISHHKKGEG